MAFCANCGTELPESGVCPMCQPVSETAENVATTPTEETTATESKPEMINVQVSLHPLVRDCMISVKQFFSAQPQNSIVAVNNANENVWILLSSLSILFTALGFVLIPKGIISDVLSVFEDFLGSSLSNNIPYGSLFGWGLLLSLISFIVLCVCLKGVYAIFQLNVSFKKILNLVSVILLPFTASVIAAIIFSFFLAQFSVLLLIIGWLGSVVLLYTGVQKLASFKVSPFWALLVVHAIDIVILAMIGNKIITSVLGKAISDAFGGLGSWF